MSSSPLHDVELVVAAKRVRSNAYAPYSGFSVGAAVRLVSGEMSLGVNFENVSSGLTVCAERNALAAALSQGAAGADVAAVAVAAEATQPPSPCGACRQVFIEILPDEVPIYMVNVRTDEVRMTTVGELMPLAFRATSLPKPPQR